MVSPDLKHCANGCEEDVVVIVCDHVAEGRDNEAEISISDVGIASTPRHDCGDPECGERALCGDCWGSL